MPCPFYGKHAVELMRVLVTSGGNQCALITSHFSPCRMEINWQHPDLESCEFNNTARAVEFAQFETRNMHGDTVYPD